MSSQEEASDGFIDVIKNIGQTLMEDSEEKPLSHKGSLALQAIEMSFNEALQTPAVPRCRIASQFPLTSSPSSSQVSDACSSLRESIAARLNEGVKEGCQILPALKDRFPFFGLESNKLPTMFNNESEEPALPKAEMGKSKMEQSLKDLTEMNNYNRGYKDDNDLSELFDKLFLNQPQPNLPIDCVNRKNLALMALDLRTQSQQTNQPSTGGTTNNPRAKKQRNKKDHVDLTSLLLHCAEAIAEDHKEYSAHFLKQIRQHSDAFGDGPQRIAHYFANGLEARLAGTGFLLYSAITSRWPSPAEMLNGYQSFLLACPFRPLFDQFAVYHILRLAEKASTLHIIDFGILYGFQWPAVIEHLSARMGGPPKLKITGIEIPHPDFQRRGNIERVHRHIEKYCTRFNVPLEYRGIEKKWETIQVEDLSTGREGEAIVVNSIFRFDKLLDETVDINQSPRVVVLNLIQKINPDIFIHGIVNGGHNFPRFSVRFREALFYYLSFCDMLDSIVGGENLDRLMFERFLIAMETMNVIACEGSERIFRPMKYKQWDTLTVRCGFKLLELDGELINFLRGKMDSYHKDFDLGEDGKWVTLGWKGRRLVAISCWTPA